VLKVRVIGVLVVRDELVVQSINFRRYLPVGVPSIAVEYLNRWGIDEIALLDIGTSSGKRRPDFERTAEYARHAQVPIAVGGGIANIHDIERLIRSGADKVILNTAAVEQPALITEAAQLYGTQCIVVSIDGRRLQGGGYEAVTHGGRRATGRSPSDLAQDAEHHGAGEILLNSIDLDGAKSGYDVDLIRSVVSAVRIPVIVCGGVGRSEHFLDGIAIGASAVAAANFFHYTEHSVAIAKRFLRAHDVAVRLDTLVKYDGFVLEGSGRVAKASDEALDRLRFEHIPEEVI
jgi:cyclase